MWDTFTMLWEANIWRAQRLENNKTFWAGRDPQGPVCPALKWKAHTGTEPTILVLSAPCLVSSASCSDQLSYPQCDPEQWHHCLAVLPAKQRNASLPHIRQNHQPSLPCWQEERRWCWMQPPVLLTGAEWARRQVATAASLSQPAQAQGCAGTDKGRNQDQALCLIWQDTIKNITNSHLGIIKI